jgi:hypothetical protein
MSTQSAKRASRYQEVAVTIHTSRPSKGYAFGSAIVNGVPTDVFVGSHGHAIQIGHHPGGRWDKTNIQPSTPIVGDVLIAKIHTDVEPGKKPAAVFWRVSVNAEESDGFDDDADFDPFLDVDLNDPWDDSDYYP